MKIIELEKYQSTSLMLYKFLLLKIFLFLNLILIFELVFIIKAEEITLILNYHNLSILT